MSTGIAVTLYLLGAYGAYLDAMEIDSPRSPDPRIAKWYANMPPSRRSRVDTAANLFVAVIWPLLYVAVLIKVLVQTAKESRDAG